MRDLCVIMPVYNEEGCIVEVVESWKKALDDLCIDYEILLLNDGSTDNTAKVLFKDYYEDERVKILSKYNTGHGPTILSGYKLAVKQAKWVFQCDSDNEMSAEYFHKLWNAKTVGIFSALVGKRHNREQTTGRKLISRISRLVIKTLFGEGITDVNSPYRLFSSQILMKIIENIPEDTFAPNVLISGEINRLKLPVYEYDVPHTSRTTGEVSIVKWKLWKCAFRAFYQTVNYFIYLKMDLGDYS